MVAPQYDRSLSGHSIDSNFGGSDCQFEQTDRPAVEVWPCKKGGGSENMSRSKQFCRMTRTIWRARLVLDGGVAGAGRAPAYLASASVLTAPVDSRWPKKHFSVRLLTWRREPELAAVGRINCKKNQSSPHRADGHVWKDDAAGGKDRARPRVPASFFVTGPTCAGLSPRGVCAPGDNGQVLEWLG